MLTRGKLFVDPAGNYNTYTSDNLDIRDVRDGHKGVIQVEITSGTVTLQGRLNEDADYVDINEFAANSLVEFILPYQIRVVATGEARAWVSPIN